MKASILDGKELQNGQKFAEIKDKKVCFFKVLSNSVSKPGKHGSSKKSVKSINLLTGKNYEATYGGNINVFYIDDFEYYLLPIHMVNGEFTEFHYDLEQDLSISATEFDPSSQEILDAFRATVPGGNYDSVLVNDNGERLCLLVCDVDLEDKHSKFLWDLQYVSEDNFDKKASPGDFYNDFISKAT